MAKLLVIRGGAIGDFILTLPAIGLIRDSLPGLHIEILGYRHIASVAEGRHYAHATRSIEYAPLARFFAPGTELDPDLTAYFASFQQVVSYLHDPDGFFEGNLRRAGVRRLITGDPLIRGPHHAARHLARPLEQLALYLEDPCPQLRHTPEDDTFARHFPIPGYPSAPVLALHPGSGGERKNWPIEHWAELLRHLARAHPALRLLLIGGEADTHRLATLQRDLPAATPAINLPLPHLAALLRHRCHAYLGHDSGISHLAAATGIPALLLFGPTDPAIWAPLNPRATILRAPDGQMTALPVAQVLSRLEEVISQQD